MAMTTTQFGAKKSVKRKTCVKLYGRNMDHVKCKTLGNNEHFFVSYSYKSMDEIYNEFKNT